MSTPLLELLAAARHQLWNRSPDHVGSHRPQALGHPHCPAATDPAGDRCIHRIRAPLGFVHSEAPLYVKHAIPGVRAGATAEEHVRVHATATGCIDSIQVSWPPDGAGVTYPGVLVSKQRGAVS